MKTILTGRQAGPTLAARWGARQARGDGKTFSNRAPDMSRRFVMRTAMMAALATAAALSLAPSSRAADPDVYNIGGIFSMSGAAPYYGTVMSRGAQMAIDDINAAGGIDGVKLHLVIEDHKSGDAQAAVAGMNRLITVSNAQAVMSSFSGPTVAIAPISQEKGIFVVNGGAVSPRLIGLSSNMFHTRALATDLAAVGVYRAHERGFKRIAQIATKSEFGDSMIKAASETAKKLGMEVVAAEEFVTDATNIDTQVAKLRASHPDVVLSWPTTPQSGMVVKRVRELGMKQPIIVTEWTEKDTEIAGAANAEGTEIVIDYFSPGKDNPAGKKFYDKYVELYKTPPDYIAANYYEAIDVIAELIRRAKAKGGDYWNGNRLTEALWDNPTFDSIYGGKMVFQKNGIAQKRVAILEIKNGAQVFDKYVTSSGK